MQIEYIKTDDLKPYANNPRKNDEAIKYVAESIKQFGFKVPIVIDKNNVIVCGHTRYKAAKELNYETVPCIKADDLTDEQIRAFRLADNKVSEVSIWDDALLNIELESIEEIDMQDFNFDVFEFVGADAEIDPEDKVNERERTYKAYNLQFNDLERTAGKYQMPVIQREIINPPEKQPIGFNYVLSSKEKDRAVHFFVMITKWKECGMTLKHMLRSLWTLIVCSHLIFRCI